MLALAHHVERLAEAGELTGYAEAGEVAIRFRPGGPAAFQAEAEEVSE